MARRWFEESAVGQVIDHEIRRTETEADNVGFCSATYNPAAIRIPPAAAAGVPPIDTVHTDFSATEFAHALRIVDAFAAQPEAGTLSIDDVTVDKPHLMQAPLTLAQR